MRVLGLVSLLVSSLLVSAQNATGPTDKEPIYITSPVGTTAYLQTGKNLVIEWATNPKAPETVDIELLQDFAIRDTIASRISSNSHKFNWVIPESLESSNNYAIRIGDSDYVSYSHAFSIQGEGEASPLVASPIVTNAGPGAGVKTAMGSAASQSAHEMATSSIAQPSGSASSISAAPTATSKSGASNIMAGSNLAGFAALGAVAVALAL